jgi:hypothetical protein
MVQQIKISENSLTLLRQIQAITGQPFNQIIDDAIQPLLKKIDNQLPLATKKSNAENL